MDKDDESTDKPKPDNSAAGSKANNPNTSDSEIDTELAKEYDWTPQQAKEARLYLQLEPPINFGACTVNSCWRILVLENLR